MKEISHAVKLDTTKTIVYLEQFDEAIVHYIEEYFKCNNPLVGPHTLDTVRKIADAIRDL